MADLGTAANQGASKRSRVDILNAIRAERQMGLEMVSTLYKKAIAYSEFVLIGIMMLAFDSQLLRYLSRSPQFKRDYGYSYNDDYVIDPSWTTALSIALPVGQVVGALFAACPMDYFGRKATFKACVLLKTGIIYIQLYAQSLSVLIAGEVLAGLVLGMFAVIAPVYASEVCPMASPMRSHFTSFMSLCLVYGRIVATFVIVFTYRLAGHWAYSLPFALQWFWILIILPGLAFVPESPWWCVRNNRLEDAKEALERLTSPPADVEALLAFIVETDRLEQELEVGSTYLDCFRGANLRRTKISIVVYCTQALCGIYFVNYQAVSFQEAGVSTTQAGIMSDGVIWFGSWGMFVAWDLMMKIGRRSLFVGGLSSLGFVQLSSHFVDWLSHSEMAASLIWLRLALMLIWNLLYHMSVGSICFVLLGECSATRLRSKTIAVATAAQGCLVVANTVAMPYLTDSTQTYRLAKLGALFSALSFLCNWWAKYHVPETKGRTYEELDLLFAKNVPATEFEAYKLVGGLSAAVKQA